MRITYKLIKGHRFFINRIAVGKMCASLIPVDYHKLIFQFPVKRSEISKLREPRAAVQYEQNGICTVFSP